MTKRHVAVPVGRRIFLCAAALAAPAILSSARYAHAQAADVEALYAAAKKEGKLIWWCGIWTGPPWRRFALRS